MVVYHAPRRRVARRRNRRRSDDRNDAAVGVKRCQSVVCLAERLGDVALCDRVWRRGAATRSNAFYRRRRYFWRRPVDVEQFDANPCRRRRRERFDVVDDGGLLGNANRRSEFGLRRFVDSD